MLLLKVTQIPTYFSNSIAFQLQFNVKMLGAEIIPEGSAPPLGVHYGLKGPKHRRTSAVPPFSFQI